jgi:hypothetical protein
MAARIDKTDSAIGVFRAELAADVDPALYGRVCHVSLNSSGKAVLNAAGNSGVKGVHIPDRTTRKAGQIIDILTNGEIVGFEIWNGTALAAAAAGTNYYSIPATGVHTTTATSNVYIGHTVEADRLVVRMGGGLP